MGNLKVGSLTLGVCQTNCYYVYREGSSDALFFDPADKGDYLYQAMKDKGLTVKGILLTHGHFDHIWGVDKLRELSGAPVYACESEAKLCKDATLNVSEQVGRPCTVEPNHYVKDGEEITIAGMTCRLIATPGHTAGSCCYYFEEDGFLISGDTLFQESVGRTDLPTGSMSDIVRSVKGKLFVLPDETKVYPGHGEATSIGYEKEYNPYA